MSNIYGFRENDRNNFPLRDKEERKKDSSEVYVPLDIEDMEVQADRCMDCGTSFCNWGCPLGNLIPEWNDYALKGNWKRAYEIISQTSNFPEFTGRICPALCEASCALGVNREPVSIREIEQSIIEKAFEKGWVKPRNPKMRTGKNVAVIGSGPAGITVADELNAVGHNVTVFESEDAAGGLLRYGIPNFKLEKNIIDRRIDLMKEAGIEFQCSKKIIGKINPKKHDSSYLSIEELKSEYDSIVLACGSTTPRDLKIQGRGLDGIHFAVDYLKQHTKNVLGVKYSDKKINAKGKNVLVIGGGDTGSDCIGTAVRQGANKVYQFEIMPKPPEERNDKMPWPTYPMLLKETSSHKEGCDRKWSVSTTKFVGVDRLESITASEVKWKAHYSTGKMSMTEVKGSEFDLKVDLVLIAMGFLHTEHEGLVEHLGLDLDGRGNVKAGSNQMTSVEKVFSCGDMKTGQSLVVRAIADGRQTAKEVDLYLMGETYLEG